MRLSVLTDNSAGQNYLAEHGLSFLIETDKQKILFDTGQTNVFLQNAKNLGLTMDEVNTVILSHGHYDHGNGLNYLENKKLICHPNAFIKRYHNGDSQNIGLSLSKNDLKKRFNLVTSKKPFMITKRIFFLGEIPRSNDFESQDTVFTQEDGKNDFLKDDSALVVRTMKGLVIISGCGHAGICNTVKYAKKIMWEKNIYAIIGGFHIKKNDEIAKKTLDYFSHEKIEKVYPCHCTALSVQAEFHNKYKTDQIKTGDVIEF